MSSSALAASDHLSKVNAFVSTAGNFIDSALDQLDDQLESAMGGMSEKVGEELKEYSLTAEAMETAKYIGGLHEECDWFCVGGGKQSDMALQISMHICILDNMASPFRQEASWLGREKIGKKYYDILTNL